MLAGGANDLGGTLMEETISRMAGSEFGSYKTVADIESITGGIGRPVSQRTTVYGRVDAQRQQAARAFQGLAAASGPGRPAGARPLPRTESRIRSR